jgi:plastocyanin
MKMNLLAPLTAIVLVGLAGCGGNSHASVQVTLTSSGFSPSTVTVRFGSDLTFVNQDSASHQIGSQSCPDLATFAISGGKSATVNIGNVALVGKSCDVYDASPGASSSYTGIIRVVGSG